MESFGAVESRDALAQALRAYAAAPGRFALHLGEPVAVFREFDTVAQWAMGRFADGFDDRAALKDAAIVFIKRACFAHGVTHYQIFGLQAHEFTAEKLRARYRAMIRLTHPDVAIAGLGQDAALRVNLANDVLSDDAKRVAYDATLRHAQTVNASASSTSQSLARTQPAFADAALAAQRSVYGARHLRAKRSLGLRPLVLTLCAVCMLGLVGAGFYAMVKDSTDNTALVVSKTSRSAADDLAKPSTPSVDGVPLPSPGAAAAKNVAAQVSPDTQNLGFGPPLRSATSLAKLSVSAARDSAPKRVVASDGYGLDSADDFWISDSVQARELLGRVLTALSQSAEARLLHERLRDQRINGSLLVPALAQLDRADRWRVQHSGWVDEVHASGIVLRSRVTLDPKDSAGTPPPAVMAFILEADFRTNRDGARLTSLQLRPVP
jgi:hypothetical protein